MIRIDLMELIGLFIVVVTALIVLIAQAVTIVKNSIKKRKFAKGMKTVTPQEKEAMKQDVNCRHDAHPYISNTNREMLEELKERNPDYYKKVVDGNWTPSKSVVFKIHDPGEQEGGTNES